MKLTTQIPLQKQSENLVDYHSSILLMGSCFAAHIANKLDYFKFRYSSNPFGILYHPKAIENLLNRAIDHEAYQDNDLFFCNERWHCFDAHSDLSNASKEAVLDNLNNALNATKSNVESASHIIITFGTAWYYKYIETNKIVANCHKVPQKQFNKAILSVSEIVESIKNSIHLIRSINKNANIIFTVSPVRHLRDGFVENTQSKAHLIAAIHEVLNQNSTINNHKCYYFPSYEIMMDELRDYRFYSEDMIHPNPMAIHYIWERFTQVWMAKTAEQTMIDVDSIQKAINHKPFNANSKQHQNFLMKLETKKADLISRFPHISF